MKLAGLVFVLSIVMCVTDLAHSEDWSHFYLRAACKLMESRDFKTGNSIGKEKVIAFQARVSSRLQNVPKGRTVRFDTVLLNEGNGYSGRTGQFTAPTKGVYVFDWTITVDNGDMFFTEIVKNGSAFGYNHCAAKRQSYERNCSTTSRIRLKRGDKVWVRTTSRGTDAHPTWTTFGGHKL